MNFEKNKRVARKLAKEQAHIRKLAKKNPDRLSSKERAMLEWDLHLENYDEPHGDETYDHNQHTDRGW